MTVLGKVMELGNSLLHTETQFFVESQLESLTGTARKFGTFGQWASDQCDAAQK